MASVAPREWTYKGQTKRAWVVRWKAGGKHPSKQFDRKHDADAYKRKVEREIEDGTVTESRDRTFASVAEEFIKAQEDRYRDGVIGQSRLQKIKFCLDQRASPRFGHKNIKTVTVADVDDLYRALRKKGLSTTTAKETLIVVRMVEQYAKRRRYSFSEPTAEAMRDLRGIKAKPVETFSLEMWSRLHQAMLQPDERERAEWGKIVRSRAMLPVFVHLAAFMGLRIGEIRAITLPLLDLDAGVLRIRHSMEQGGALKGPKTPAGVRDYPIPEHLVSMLRVFISTYYVPNDKQLIFSTLYGRPLHTSNFHLQQWRPLLVRAGLAASVRGEAIHFHALRHFNASWLVSTGMPLPDVASLLGHSKFDTTLQVYAHPIIGGTQRHHLVNKSARLLLDTPQL